MSLESCIRKAGKALNAEDAAAIRAIRDDILKTRATKDTIENAAFRTQPKKRQEQDANEQAIDEYIDILDMERDFVMAQVEGAGGALANPNLTTSKFVERAAANLEEAARKFPRKSITRPPHETIVRDMKTGERLNERFRGAALKGKDPNVKLDIATERTYRTIETLWPDFYTMRPAQILAIVHTFDPTAALGLAKTFGIVPGESKKLSPRQYDRTRLDQIHSEARGTDNMFVPQSTAGGVIDDGFFHGWGAEVILDWVKKNETLPLYYKVESAAERDMVDTNPDNPLSVTIKYAQVVGEAESAPPLGIRKSLNWLRDTLGVAGALGAVPQTKLKDFVRHGMDSVKEYTRTVKLMDAWMNGEMEGHHLLASNWLEFNRDNKEAAKLLGEFMHASTLAGVDVMTFSMPDKATMTKMNKEKRAMWLKRQADFEKLKPFWDKLGKAGKRVDYLRAAFDPRVGKIQAFGLPQKVSEAQMIYLSVRDTYSSARDMLIDSLETRINQTEANAAAKAALIAKLRKQFEAGMITPYFPLSRFGKYQAVAKTKEGETVAFIKRENSRDRNKWMQEMRAEGFSVHPFEEQLSDAEQMNKIDPGFVASVTGLLDESVVITDDEFGEPQMTPGSSIQDEIWQLYLRTLPEMSARKAYIHRVGRLGFTHDALRSFADHMFHGTHQLAKLKYGFFLSETLKSIEEDSVIVMQRAANIKNMREIDWRPEGFEGTDIHDVMFDTTIGGPRYRELFTKYNKKATKAEASKQATDQLLKEGEHDEAWAVPLANEMKRRHAYNMNPKSAAWSTKLTAFGFLWFLSTSPAAGVLNLTQTAISAYPILRARFSGQGAGMELLKAAKDFTGQKWLGLDKQGVQRMTANLKNDLNKKGKQKEFIGERAAMQKFWEIGIFSKTRTRELMGLSEGSTQYSTRTAKWMETAGYIFHKTEEMNRAVTALAAYRLARKKFAGNKKMSAADQHNAAIDMADELIEMSHYDYTNTNRPRFMQGDKGRVVFLFRNYSLNMQYRLIRDFRDGIWKNDNIPKSERKEARSRLLGMIGMTTIFAGAAGWPMMWAVETIANNLLGDEDDPFDAKTETRKLLYDATEEYIAEGWGQTVATAVMKGPWSAFTGADLSQRASLNNLWIREIPENLKDNKQDLLKHLMGELAGPIAGVGFNYAAGFDAVQAGHVDRGIEKFTPKFVGDIFKSIRYATQGAQTYQGDMILSPEAMTTRNVFLQASGFTPTALSDRYEQNRAIKDMEQKLRGRRQDLMNQLFMAWRVGDQAEGRSVLKEILQWNIANGQYPITAQGIIQSAKTRAQYDMRTVGGVAVDKRLQYLQETMRFTQRPQ